MKRLARLWVLFVFAPVAGRAVDEPHVKACDPSISCTSCHTLMNAPGGSLTSVAGNFNLCSSCHNQPGVGAKHGFPWYSEDQAIPGVAGHSHRWDAALTNPALGAQPPLDAAMAQVVTAAGESNLQCSVCHDQHKSNPQFGGSQFVSVAMETDLPASTGTGTGSLRVLHPAASATAKGYMVEIVAPGAVGTATYRLSNDNGKTWFGWNGTAWTTYSITTAPARGTGTAQALNDGSNVTVTFSGTGFATGDRWTFYIGYPMLRASLVASAMCEDCHRGMVHDTARVAGDDPAYAPNVGTNTFSHPVGVTLNASGAGYDRAAPLAADGHPQSGAAAPSDLVLAATDNTVRCLTCHSVHNAMSNALTASR